MGDDTLCAGDGVDFNDGGGNAVFTGNDICVNGETNERCEHIDPDIFGFEFDLDIDSDIVLGDELEVECPFSLPLI